MGCSHSSENSTAAPIRNSTTLPGKQSATMSPTTNGNALAKDSAASLTEADKDKAPAETAKPADEAPAAPPPPRVAAPPAPRVPKTFHPRSGCVTDIGFGRMKKENQDTYVEMVAFGGRPHTHVFAVFDGHGSQGYKVAKFIEEALPKKLLQKQEEDDQGAKTGVPLAEWAKAALEFAFTASDDDLRDSGIDCTGSGTTATVAYLIGPELFVASVGDSRAVLVQRCAVPGGEVGHVALPLSDDHRLTREDERERVLAAGARVQPVRSYTGQFVGEPRLWFKDMDFPGLLVSRSIGDHAAATIGCTAVPEVKQHTLADGDRYLIVGSDGIWDVVANEEAMDVVLHGKVFPYGGGPGIEGHMAAVGIANRAAGPFEGEGLDCGVLTGHLVQRALLEWEDRHMADNVTAIVIEFAEI